jgi:hypothetical protein
MLDLTIQTRTSALCYTPGTFSLNNKKKHLYYCKGTYAYTAKPKVLILNSVSWRLKNLLNDCFGEKSTTK